MLYNRQSYIFYMIFCFVVLMQTKMFVFAHVLRCFKVFYCVFWVKNLKYFNVVREADKYHTKA